MSNSVNQLNQRISNLYALVGQGGGGGGSSTLSQVLTNGNDAGGQDITDVNNINLITINNLPYPLINPTPELSDVLTAGNSAKNDILLNNYDIAIPTQNNLISLLPNASATNPNITLTDGTTTNTIDKNGYTTRNSTQNATHFLNFSDSSATGVGAIQKNAGIQCNPSTRTFSVNNNNVISGQNVISLIPNASTNNPNITLTDGTGITNTIDKNGYTTRNSTQNATFFLNFSGSSATNVGSIEKNAGIQCNPNLGSITLESTAGSGVISLTPDLNVNDPQITLTDGTISNFITKNGMSGKAVSAGVADAANAVALTSDNTSTTCYIPFSKTTSSFSPCPLYVDDTPIGASPLTYNPSTSTLTAAIFNGNATNANNVTIVTDTTSTFYYPTFVSGNGTGKPLKINDNLLSSLFYQPSTNTLTASNFQGSASGVVTTESDANTSYNVTFTDGVGTNKSLLVDTLTTPFTYNPFTSTLSATRFQPVISSATFNASLADLVVTTGGYAYYVYKSTPASNITINNPANLPVEYLIIGGGGGGGGSYGGGGGAGRVISGTSLTITSGSYPVVVGTGGTGYVYSTQAFPTNGNPSSIFGVTASGGGSGAGYRDTAGAIYNAATGGSGGGGGGAGAFNTSNLTGAASTGGGFAGGNGASGTSAGGGGGGAGAAGGTGSGSTAGAGGAGSSSVTAFLTPISGASNMGATWTTATSTGTIIAGGGGGGNNGVNTIAAGGAGGGGNGGSNYDLPPKLYNVAQPGATNTGSGGGASGGNYASPGVNANSGAGGSGLVVLRISLGGVAAMLDAFQLTFGNPTSKITSANLNLYNLPTSASGLVTGDVWRNGSVLNIVP